MSDYTLLLDLSLCAVVNNMCDVIDIYMYEQYHMSSCEI